MKFCIAALLIFALLSLNIRAFETDQFNLPSEPLADIGEELTDYVRQNIEKAVNKINAEITETDNCFQKNQNCDSKEKLEEKLKNLRSAETVEREVFKLLGDSIPPFTPAQSWVDLHKFKAQPARFKPSFSDSIYKFVPTSHFTISPTINAFGFSFGTDKIAHIFQQGFTYRQISEKNLAKGLSQKEAVKKAVNWGRKSEKTFYGFWVSGVYSNADLAANFIGMKFYENLTNEIELDKKRVSPILELKEGKWNFRAEKDFLTPFFTNHLNEAWTPSVYANIFGSHKNIKKIMKSNDCNQWKKTFPNYAKTDYEKIYSQFETLYGEDYGFKRSKKFITIASVCF